MFASFEFLGSQWFWVLLIVAWVMYSAAQKAAKVANSAVGKAVGKSVWSHLFK